MKTTSFRKTRHPAKGAARRVRPLLEALEVRDLPTAYVFVDFGDNFPLSGSNRVLTTTVGAVRDVATAQLDNGGNPIPNTVVQGPQLTDANNRNYADNTAVSFTRSILTAGQRAQLMADARRAFASVDVTVVELTRNGQTLADGRHVAGASIMAGVSQILRSNNTNSKDVYIITATPAIGASNDNPNTFATNGYGGIAPTGTVLGEATDLGSSFNNHDDLVLNFRNDANTIVHEAGHGLGLQHAVTTAAPGGSAINNAIHTSEVMSYLGTNFESSIFFSRFPMVRGDNNTDGASPPLSNNDLQARQGQLTPFDQLRVDPNVGENPNLHYISGTGAHDIITLTKSPIANRANVRVQAFATFTDNTYQTPIIVPGTTITTYDYTVDLDRPLLIQGGLGDDRIIIDGALNGRVDVDGMAGNDELIINDQAFLPALATNYTVTSSEVTRWRIDPFAFPFGLTVGYGDIDQLTLNAGGVSPITSINVDSLPAAPVTLNLHNPVNFVTVGQPNSPVNGRLTINGGGVSDVLIINDQAFLPALVTTYTVTSSDVTRWRVDPFGFPIGLMVSYGGIEELALNAGGVSPITSINVDSLPAAPVTLNLHNPVNFVTVGQPNSPVNGRLTINGGGVSDVLIINDQALLPASPATYTVTSTEVARERFVGPFLTRLTVGYDGIERLTLNTGGSVLGSNVNVNSLPAAPVTVNLGLAKFANIVAVGQAAASVDGRLTVNGGAGLDILIINDQSLFLGTPASYTVTSTEVARNRLVLVPPFSFFSLLSVGYTGIESLGLNAGGSVSGSFVNVLSVAAATPVSLTLNSVVNVVTVGDSGNSLDPIAGPLTIHGGNGYDVLTLNDQGSASENNYNVSANLVSRGPYPDGTPLSVSIGYDAIESVDLNTGRNYNVIFVSSTAAGTSLTVRGNPNGLDAFAIGFGGDLNQILGPVSVYGQLEINGHGYDFGYYYDYLNTAPHTYTFLGDPADPTALRAERSGIAAVTYHGVNQVIPYLSRVGGNYANVQAVPATMFLNMVAAKNDVVTLGSLAPALGGTVAGLKGSISVLGFGTRVILDDSGDQSPRQISVNPKQDAYGDYITGLVAGRFYSRLDAASSLTILGGQGDDTFQINGTAFDPAIRIDGGLGVNTLDYSAVTSGVVVNLPLGTATGLTGGIAKLRNLIGGSGNDVLVGDAAVNSLWGRAGRDLLIGGLGADQLDGEGNDDILIGGYTAYDSNATALDAIMKEWTRTDLDVLGPQESYKTRIDHLMSGSGLNGAYVLKSSKGQGTVFDDGFADVLTGGDGLDWFFGDKKVDTIWNVPPEKVS